MSSSPSKKEAFKKYEFKKLCHLLGFKPTEIRKLLDNIEPNYVEWIKRKEDKNGNPKKYLDGTIKTRTFRNPSTFLKEVQRRIKNNILGKIVFPDCVHGGRKGRSNITNAKPHQGKKYVFETDLQEFYPSVSKEKVYRAFLDIGYSSHIAHWLTVLTTKSNELPQGGPTSTALANLVFLNTDKKLILLCKERQITYTRYIDDLTFSSHDSFSDIIGIIIGTVMADKFKINRRKTIYRGNQSVTGVDVFLNKIDAPKHIIEKSQDEINNNDKKKPYTNYLNNIRKTNIKKRKLATNKGIDASGAGH
jgi:RNA-directed DNA polymerase